MNVALACAGHNLRLILKRLRIYCARILGATLLRDMIGLHGTRLAASIIRWKRRMAWQTEPNSTHLTLVVV